MKIERYDPVSFYTDSNQGHHEDEGGFDLIGFTDTIIRRWTLILLITCTTTALAVVKVLTGTSEYRSYFEILSEPITIPDKVASGSEDDTDRIFAVELDDVQLKILISPRLVEPVVEKLNSKYPELEYEYLIQKLKIQSNEDNNVLTVFYQHPDEEQVEDVLNELSQAYVDYSLETRQSGVNRGIDFVEEQLKNLRYRVNELQQRMQQIRQTHNFINPDTTAQQLAARLDSLRNRQQELEDRLGESVSISQDLERELREDFDISSTAVELQTESYSKLLAELRVIDTEIARKSVILSDNHPDLQVLRQQKQRIVGLIERESDTLRNKANSKIERQNRSTENTKQKVASLENQIKQWSVITREYNDIKRELTLATNKLNEFAIQRDSLRVDASQTEAPWKLLTPVTSLGIDSANLVNYGILGAGFGLLVGVGISLGLDKYGDKIYTANQVKQVTNLPVVGMIPHNDQPTLQFAGESKSKLKALMGNNAGVEDIEDSALQLYQKNNALLQLISPSVEAFRFLGANLGLFEVDNQIKSFIITSAVSGEGKSTVSFNLAKTVATVGRKVLLIDTDMRSQYKLSDRMGLSQTSGLSNFLLESDADVLDFIQKSPIEDNLSVLTAGNAKVTFDASFDPSRLLTSAKMHSLREELQKHFDLVVYDVSPLVGYADVSLLKSQSDGVVLVTGLGQVETLKLKEALTQLTLSNTPILGVVMNQIKSR